MWDIAAHSLLPGRAFQAPPTRSTQTLGLAERRTRAALPEAALRYEALWLRFSPPDIKQLQQRCLRVPPLFGQGRNNGEKQALLGQFVRCIFRRPIQRG